MELTVLADYIITGVGLLFGFMMFPQIRDSWRRVGYVNTWTAGLTTIGLFLLAVAFTIKEMWLPASSELFVTLTWFIVWFLAYKDNKQ